MAPRMTVMPNESRNIDPKLSLTVDILAVGFLFICDTQLRLGDALIDVCEHIKYYDSSTLTFPFH